MTPFSEWMPIPPSLSKRPKKVLLVISGSIAAYKAADLASLFQKQGHEVRCVLTESAKNFIPPLVLESITNFKAESDLFGESISGTEHIEYARWPDVIVCAPATSNFIAKAALGLSTDLATTILTATKVPVLFCPAMNTVMWEHEKTKEHLEILKKRGHFVLDPDSGKLACGELGAGKLVRIDQIVQEAISLTVEKDFLDQKVLITAGPTISRIDPVRYLTNPSSGRMGIALSEVLQSRGAEVFLILGKDKGVDLPRNLVTSPHPITVKSVETAEEMLEVSLSFLPKLQGMIATAAVMDYKVQIESPEKKKRSSHNETLDLVPSVDVLSSLVQKKSPGTWAFGFAAEDQDFIIRGTEKLQKKNLDYLFVNPIATKNKPLPTGFSTTDNTGWFLQKNEEPHEFPLMSKHMLSQYLLDELRSS